MEAATGTAPGTSPGQAPSRTGYCCVGGAYYGCPTHAALAKCTGFDVSGCLEDCPQADTACARACSQNASNAQTDPSACTHLPSMDTACADFDAGSSSTGSSSGSAPPAPPPTPKNACGGFFTGTECQVGGGCIGGGHCTQGKCYPNDVGNPCIYQSDCGDGNHCTAGCCANSSKGSACDAPWDCTSGKCTSNVCQ